MMRKLFYFFILYFLTLFGSSQENTYINYTVDDGLSSNMVYCVQQDDDGFIWFGTDAGISKYDGYEFTNYTLEDGLPDIEILHFFKDSHSRIWFFTLNGKVGFLQNGLIYSSKNTKWLAPLDFNNRITSILEKDSKLYFSSKDSKVKVLDTTHVIEIDLGKTNTLNSFCVCGDDLLIVSTTAIFLLNQDFTIERKQSFKYREHIYPFCYKNKMYSFNRTTLQHGIVQISDDSIRRVNLPSMNYILNFEKHNDKLYLFRRNDVSTVTDEVSLDLDIFSKNLNSVSSMLIDKEDNYWFTSIEKGVYFKPQSEIELQLSARYVTALETWSNELLVAHDKQFVSSLDQSGTRTDFMSFKDHNNVNLIHNDTFGNLWVIRNNGTFLNKKKISFAGGLSLLSAKNSFFLTGRSLAVAGKNTTNTQLKKYRLESYGLSSTYLGMDSILIGTDNGLFLFNQDTISNYPSPSILKSRITNLVLDDPDHLWAGTGGNGLVKFSISKGVVNKHISIKDGLVSDIIDKMLLTDSIIWISTPQGINKIVFEKNGDYNISILDRSNGLRSYKINDIKLFKGDIYLASNDGLYSFPKDIDLSESNNFKLFIDKVFVDNIRTNKNEFQHYIENIQLHFKALTYRNHNSLIYQYQLNLNETALNNSRWLDTKINQVNFSRISPGNYSFYLRAKTKNSSWSAPLEYNFKIVPAFWQKTRFQISLAFIFCLLIGITFYQININRLAQKNLEKAKLVAELKALKAQINPHFLFNVLNSIQSFILENEKNIALEYLVKYGKLMRMVLDHSDHLVVPLSSELEMLRLYTDLEMLRLKKGFEFDINCSDYFHEHNVRIPSMVIQPFIENAIWHGLSHLNHKGKVTLTFIHNNGYIEVKILDNGIGFENTSGKEDNHKSSGVRLVKERLDLIQDAKSFKNHLNIDSKPQEGTLVTMRFSDTLT